MRAFVIERTIYTLSCCDLCQGLLHNKNAATPQANLKARRTAPILPLVSAALEEIRISLPFLARVIVQSRKFHFDFAGVASSSSWNIVAMEGAFFL